MKIKDKDILSIERFFNLELSEEELLAFEIRIAKEPGFAKKLDLYKESMDLVEKKYNVDIEKTRLEKWRKIIAKENTPKATLIHWRWVVGIAASIVLIFFGWYYANHTQQQNLAAIIQDSWDKKIGLDYRMMRTTNRDSLQTIILNGFDAYEAKKYREAITIFKSFTPITPYYEDAMLITGLSQYRLGKVDEGLKSLEILSNHPTGKKTKVALWYQGLIYLDTGDTEAAQKFLWLPDNKEATIRLKE